MVQTRSDVNMIRLMCRFSPIPMASLAMRISKPESGSLNRVACAWRACGGKLPYTTQALRPVSRSTRFFYADPVIRATHPTPPHPVTNHLMDAVSREADETIATRQLFQGSDRTAERQRTWGADQTPFHCIRPTIRTLTKPLMRDDGQLLVVDFAYFFN